MPSLKTAKECRSRVIGMHGLQVDKDDFASCVRMLKRKGCAVAHLYLPHHDSARRRGMDAVGAALSDAVGAAAGRGSCTMDRSVYPRTPLLSFL